MLIVIPARKGSKGLPFKNRKLLSHTLDDIPKSFLQSTYVSTDDEEIKNKAKKACKVHNRSLENSQDETSTLSLMKEIKSDLELSDDEVVVMLYLTYPERTFDDVLKIYNFFLDNNLKSLLCRKEVKSNPFLCMYDTGSGNGKQIIKHNLYRRQDYPKCFEVCHFVSIFRASEVEKLNNNMFNEETYFYEINDKVDVDDKKDLETFLNNRENCV